MGSVFIGAVIVAVVWMLVSMSSKTKAVVAFHAIDMAEPWFRENGISSSSANFASYDTPSLVRHPGAVALVGTARDDSGEQVGFVLEVMQGVGVVASARLQPYGVATWHQRASQQAALLRLPLIDVLLAMAEQHGQKHSALP